MMRVLPWAEVAQLVEHSTENAGVTGSIPVLGIFLTKDKIEQALEDVSGVRLTDNRHSRRAFIGSSSVRTPRPISSSPGCR